jgi:hypothetical protein
MRPYIFEFDSRDGRNEVNAIRLRSQLHDLVRFAEILAGNIEAAETEGR